MTQSPGQPVAPREAPSHSRPRRALVTGAGSGIGRATATMLADQGWHLFLTDLDEGRLNETLDNLGVRARIAGDVAGAPADLTISATAGGLVAEAVRHLGGLDTLINSHGLNHPGDRWVESVTDEVFESLIKVNLASFFYTTRAALVHLVAGNAGSIVNLSSATAIGTAGTAPAYAMSKLGVIGLTQVTARQMADRGVRCNAVCPGPTDTPMMRSALRKLGQDFTFGTGTIQRLATPDEVAEVVVFLASDRSSYVTGSTYAVDGGRTLH